MFQWTATAAIGIHPTKAWLSQLVNFKNAIWTWGYFRRTICKKILFSTWKNATETYGILQTAFGASWVASEIQGRHGVCEGWCEVWEEKMKSKHQSWLAKWFGLGLLCWGYFREFMMRFIGKRPALFKLAQWHFQQDNAPVYNSILVTDYFAKMGIKTVPYHCNRRRLLRRGLEFHVYTINKSAHTKKSGNLFNDPHIW